MRLSTISPLALVATVPGTSAWGTVGHATVATIAQKYLTVQGSSYVSGLLGSGVTMASVASWADTYRSTTAGKFSSGFHYIDAEDNPPSSCSVDQARDCGTGGCIVTAIANYTQRVNDLRHNLDQRKQALEFLIHFIGDITQPLHDEAKAVGGNQIAVLWNGATTNLHSVWDTQMVVAAAGGSTQTAYEAWAITLEARIDTGIYSSQKAGWISCKDIKTASTCALSWASDANILNCQYVLKVDETGQELSGAYYSGAKPLVEQQVAKAGYRLATWINALAAAA